MGNAGGSRRESSKAGGYYRQNWSSSLELMKMLQMRRDQRELGGSFPKCGGQKG